MQLQSGQMGSRLIGERRLCQCDSFAASAAMLHFS
jgi:hypothetical protein